MIKCVSRRRGIWILRSPWAVVLSGISDPEHSQQRDRFWCWKAERYFWNTSTYLRKDSQTDLINSGSNGARPAYCIGQILRFFVISPLADCVLSECRSSYDSAALLETTHRWIRGSISKGWGILSTEKAFFSDVLRMLLNFGSYKLPENRNIDLRRKSLLRSGIQAYEKDRKPT